MVSAIELGGSCTGSRPLRFGDRAVGQFPMHDDGIRHQRAHLAGKIRIRFIEWHRHAQPAGRPESGLLRVEIS